MKKPVVLAVLLLAISLSLAGCVSYYRITDPVSGNVYYTKDIDHESGGAIVFKDEVSRREVTLQQSEVMEIKKDQFDAAGRTRETE